MKQVTSLYFGGGTPTLAADRIGEIIDALQAHFIITEGIGLELHPDHVTVEILTVLRLPCDQDQHGIQSFRPKFRAFSEGRPSIPLQ